MCSAGDVKRQRTSGEEVGEIAFGLEIEFGCPGGDEVIPTDGKARASFEREQEALQCDRLYERLSNSLNRHGLASSYLMMRLYHDYPECGLSEKQPPRHEVYSLQHRDVRIPGHPEGKPKPRYYSTWGFRYEDSCEAGLSGLKDDLRPVELNTPVLTEAEWLNGFPSLGKALAIIREATEGQIRVGYSYGTHVNVSFAESSDESDDDWLTTLKRLLTLIWLVEDHLFGLTCPGRQESGGLFLAAERDWAPMPDASGGATRDDEASDNLPDNIINAMGREMMLIWKSSSILDLTKRVCWAPRTGDVRRRAVRIHRAEDDVPAAIIRRNEHSDCAASSPIATGTIESPCWDGDGSDDEDNGLLEDDQSSTGGSASTRSSDESTDDAVGDADDGELERHACRSGGPSGKDNKDPCGNGSADGADATAHDQPESNALIVETMITIVLALAKLSHHRQPNVCYRAVAKALYDITSSGSPSIERAAAIVEALEVYLDCDYARTLSFDREYFETRLAERARDLDPDLDVSQMWIKGETRV
ncbi:hypothetical protein FALBO_7388 [Fusarium albosuccineum]|uniref:Uncharacterized protein n=1 Tax=Fusarium albosuccineum TaxID=1237068 RepID=A0A8H4LCI7_9HYPO|nr:hypothetical protein FALBO_7388 [Fusarium albosuccineum]